MARMYARTGLSTNCALIKTGFKNLRTGTEAKIRPFVDAALCFNIQPTWRNIKDLEIKV